MQTNRAMEDDSILDPEPECKRRRGRIMTSTMTADFVYYGVPCSKTIQRTIEKRLLKWVRSHPLFPKWSRPFCYIYLQRDATERVVTCFIEIQTGNKIWSAVDYGKNTLHAFLKCLPQLRLRTSIFDLAPEPPDAFMEFEDLSLRSADPITPA